MAILTRPSQNKVFGSTALAAELTIFGSATTSTDIDLILNSIEAQRGWGTVGANDFPPLEWFNALGYGLSYQTSYLYQNGVPAWTALQEYYINSICMGSDGKIYRSLSGVSGTPNSGNNPTTDTANWVSPFVETYGDQTIAGIKTFSSPIKLSNSGFTATLQSGNLASNVVITLPSSTSTLETTNLTSLPTVVHSAVSKTIPADADEIPLLDSTSAFSLKKLTWLNLKNALTTLFAPTASPAFTGIPTAPTPSVGDNDTSIATTAFVNAEISNDVGVANSALVKTALNAGGAAPIYACRAWVNFNGTGTVAIRGSGNVSSITDNGTGNYTVNFATAMSDTNFVGHCSTNAVSTTDRVWANVSISSASNLAVGYYQLGAAVDNPLMLVSVFR